MHWMLITLNIISSCRNSSLRNLNSFLDDKGLLRIRGRLENAEISFDSKHSVMISKGHLTKLFIRFQQLFLKHGGVTKILPTFEC